MSLSSLAQEEISSREVAFIKHRMKPRVSEHANMILQKLDLQPTKLDLLNESLLPLAAAAPIEPTKGSNALDSLARYVPTEAITLYVAACSVMAALKGKLPPEAPYWVYWGFVVLTPVLFLIIFIGMRRSDKLPPLPSFKQWPWWKLTASATAFGVWALAVPGTPYLTGEVGGIIAGFLALFVSTFLTLLEPIFKPQSKSGS